MTVAFTRTREQLRDMVLRKVRALAIGQTANADDEAIVFEAIDLRLKEMHRLGTFWRKVTPQPVSFTLSAGAATATAASDYLFPIRMTARNVSMDDPVDIIGPRSYAEIMDKTTTGVPQKALHTGSGVFVFWPIPTSNTTIKLTYEKIADDTAANTAPDVDVAMLRWLKDIIAYDIADDFSIPEARIVRMMQESRFAELQIRKLNALRVDNEVTEYTNY